MAQKKLFRFVCKNGHSYMDFGPWEMKVTYSASDSEQGSLNTGPLCPLCYVSWLRAEFAADMVVVEKRAVKPKIAPQQPLFLLKGCTHCQGNIAWFTGDEMYRCVQCGRSRDET